MDRMGDAVMMITHFAVWCFFLMVGLVVMVACLLLVGPTWWAASPIAVGALLAFIVNHTVFAG